MRVKEIMTRHEDHLPPSATLQKVCEEMKTHDFGFLPIEEKGHLVGVVTDRDIAIRAVARGLAPNEPINKLMTRKVITIHEDDDVHDAAKLMEQKQVRRLVVVDQKEKPTGVISLGDIATKCDETNLWGELIHAVSEKSH